MPHELPVVFDRSKVHHRVAVLISIYGGDKPDQVISALQGIVERQTLPPNLVTIVCDGPIPETLGCTLEAYRRSSIRPVEILPLPENQGLANALNAGLATLAGRCEYILRTDADDISRPERVAQQIAYMDAHPEVGAASGQVEIFEERPGNRVGQRKLPVGEALHEFAMYRTPLNHSCSIFRAAALEAVRFPDTRLPFEDWWVCLRLMKHGWKIGVMDVVQLDFRGGSDMIRRRAGQSYAAQERQFFLTVAAEGLMSRQVSLRNLVMRSMVRALPMRLIETFYRRRLHG